MPTYRPLLTPPPPPTSYSGVAIVHLLPTHSTIRTPTIPTPVLVLKEHSLLHTCSIMVTFLELFSKIYYFISMETPALRSFPVLSPFPFNYI